MKLQDFSKSIQMKQAAKLTLKQKEIDKELFVSVANLKSIIGYPQEVNTNVNPVSLERLYVVEHYYINLSYPTTIGILE